MVRPLKRIVFEPGDEIKFGIFAVSEVLDPAIKEDWVFFSNQENNNNVNLSIQDEEQRIVFGPVLIPDMEVYRNQNGEEYDLTIDAPTIERIIVNFFEHNRANNVNADHQNELLDGFTFFQSIITNDLVPFVKGYEHLPKGTAFLGAKVKDATKWQEIKDKKYKGWSIHAAFRQVPVQLSNNDSSKELEELLPKLFSQI